MVGNNLSLESVRDESSTSSYGSSVGMGVGVGKGGISSVSANASMNSGDSLNKKVVLSSITGDKVNIDTANNTNIKGSLIAAGSEDANGKFVDNGNLVLSTNTVTFSNLSNTSYSSSTGLQAGVSVSTTKGNTGVSSASYGASTSLGYSVTKTLATLGTGDITIKDKENSDDLARLNTDTSKVNKDLYSGGISSSVSATLDTRLLTEKGRASIKDDIQKASTIKDAINQIVTTDRAGALDFFKETEKNVKVLDGIKSTIANNPELAQNLSNPNLTPEQKQSMLNDVASSVAVSLGYIPASTKLVYTDETGANGETVKGHYSSQTNTSYINDKYNDSTKELVSTAGHETQHAMDAQAGVKVTNKADNETYATNFGNMVSNYTDYALNSTGNQSMADTNNHNGALTLNSPTQSVNIITSPLLTQNNSEFAGVDKGLGEDDVLVPVNKRLSGAADVYLNNADKIKKYAKLGFDVKTPYTKYDLLSLNFDNPQKLENALKQAGFNSIDDFRQAYANNPSDPKVKSFVNANTPSATYIAPNYTFESRQLENGVIGGNGTILGEKSGYQLVNNLQLLQDDSSNRGKNYVQYITDKQHILGISNDDLQAIRSKVLNDGNQDKRNGIDIHSGSCYASTGCVTSTTIPFSVLNHQKVANDLIKIAPSLGTSNMQNNFEPTYIYLPTKNDPQGGKK